MADAHEAYLVQILLPLWDNRGEPLESHLYAVVRRVLVERFGGLTAYARSPAEGIWRRPDDQPVRDQIVVFEVMVAEFDLPWWQQYRARLEQAFRQDTVVVRAQMTVVI